MVSVGEQRSVKKREKNKKKSRATYTMEYSSQANLFNAKQTNTHIHTQITHFKLFKRNMMKLNVKKEKEKSKKKSAELSVGHLWPSRIFCMCDSQYTIKYYACTNDVPYTGTMTSYTLNNNLAPSAKQYEREIDSLTNACLIYFLFFQLVFIYALHKCFIFRMGIFIPFKQCGTFFGHLFHFTFFLFSSNEKFVIFNGKFEKTIHILMWFFSLIMCILFLPFDICVKYVLSHYGCIIINHSKMNHILENQLFPMTIPLIVFFSFR